MWMGSSLFAVSIAAEAVFFLVVAMLVWRRVSLDERTGISICKKIGAAFSDIAKKHIPHLIFNAARIEGRMFKSAALFIVRKTDVPLKADEIPYGRDWRVTGYSLVIVAFVELVVVDALCVHFAGEQSEARLLLLAISVYFIVWSVGFVAGSKTMPCYAGEEGLVLACGIMHRIEIPWEGVLSVCLRKENLEKRSSLIRSGRHLHLNNGSQTNELALYLHENSAVFIDGELSGPPICKISFSADSPSAAKEIIESYLPKCEAPR